jgi:hypothetical protein
MRLAELASAGRGLVTALSRRCVFFGGASAGRGHDERLPVTETHADLPSLSAVTSTEWVRCYIECASSLTRAAPRRVQLATHGSRFLYVFPANSVADEEIVTDRVME